METIEYKALAVNLKLSWNKSFSRKMNFKVAVCIFCLIIVACTATEWKEIRSPMESPHYKEIVEKLLPSSAEPNQTITPRITNGLPASLGQFPYQVYLYLYDTEGNTYLCGGSIIKKRWILTASHCVDGIVRVTVHLGAINRYGDGGLGAYIRALNVTQRSDIILHPDYLESIFRADIALIRLPEDAPIENSNVGLLSLPDGSDLTKNLDNLIGTVSGFGRFSDSSSSTSPTMNYIALQIRANTLCSTTYGFSVVTAANICLGSVNRGSVCGGDSGGPLTVIGRNGVPIQVGIVSFGAADGCELNLPQVFTRVTSHLTWIQTITYDPSDPTTTAIPTVASTSFPTISTTSSSSTLSKVFTALSLPIFVTMLHFVGIKND